MVVDVNVEITGYDDLTAICRDGLKQFDQFIKERFRRHTTSRWRHVLLMMRLNAKDSQMLRTLMVGMQKSNAWRWNTCRTIMQHHCQEELKEECPRWQNPKALRERTVLAWCHNSVLTSTSRCCTIIVSDIAVDLFVNDSALINPNNNPLQWPFFWTSFLLTFVRVIY